MRILLDECVPLKLPAELFDHEVRSVVELGWSGFKNGPLIRLAEKEFDVFLTVDQGITYQQSLTGVNLAVAILAATSNDIDDLRPLIPSLLESLDQITSGEVVVIRD